MSSRTRSGPTGEQRGDAILADDVYDLVVKEDVVFRSLALGARALIQIADAGDAGFAQRACCGGVYSPFVLSRSIISPLVFGALVAASNCFSRTSFTLTSPACRSDRLPEAQASTHIPPTNARMMPPPMRYALKRITRSQRTASEIHLDRVDQPDGGEDDDNRHRPTENPPDHLVPLNLAELLYKPTQPDERADDAEGNPAECRPSNH